MAQLRHGDFALLQCLRGTVYGPVNLARVVGNQHQIDAGTEGLGGNPANAEVVYRAHVQIVGDQDTVVVPVAAQQAVNDSG